MAVCWLKAKDVSMSGQDVKRGTFSHRQLLFSDENTNKEYNRLSHFQDNGEVPNLQFFAERIRVFGFEYGYALANPNALVLWEAQFGDFSMVRKQSLTSLLPPENRNGIA